MKIAFLPIAQAELDDAIAWYEEQAVGLGDAFLNEIDQSLRLIASYPLFQPQVKRAVRRCLVNRFPYGIFFGVAGGTIIVVAVAHLKRKPAHWESRVD